MRIGDRRYVAEWTVRIGGDEVNGVNPDKCVYGESVLINTDLEEALEIANGYDLNGEGTVSDQEWSGEIWHTVQRYSCLGEPLLTAK